MKILRTPEERFTGLPDFPFAPCYTDELPGYEGLRIHYLDIEGHESRAAQGERLTFLCLHGQPTWSYLYRHMIPVFSQAGHRVVAPDLIGFGRSDKPADEDIYTFDFHRLMLIRFIERLNLTNVVLVVQDWGGILGLTLPMEMPQRIRGLLVMNTMFATGDTPLSKGFLDWRAWSNANPDMAIGRLIGRSNPHLSAAELAAYDAPFPSADYKPAVRRFPNLVPDHPDAPGAALSRQARDWFSSAWSGRTFMAIGMKDPVLGPEVMADVRRHIRGCPPPYEVVDGGHFVQERGVEMARAALDVLTQ